MTRRSFFCTFTALAAALGLRQRRGLDLASGESYTGRFTCPSSLSELCGLTPGEFVIPDSAETRIILDEIHEFENREYWERMKKSWPTLRGSRSWRLLNVRRS